MSIKPNWPFIGIVAGAVVAVTLIAVMFISTLGGTGSVGLPTTVALSSIPDGSVEKEATLSVAQDGCSFVTIDGTKSLAIWPEGFSQDADLNVVDTNGTIYADGDSLSVAAVATDRAAALELDGGGDTGYLGKLITQCQGDDTHVVIITSTGG